MSARARAVILAAGEGTRLRPLTSECPKCLVPLVGAPLLDRQLDVLRRGGVDDITLVGGYRAEMLGGRNARVVVNERYAVTNMVESLFCARDVFAGDRDIVVVYGDIVFEPRVLAAVLGCDAPVAVACDMHWLNLWRLRFPDPLSDAETFSRSPDGRVLELGRQPRSLADIDGQYLGLFKVRAADAPRFLAERDGMDRDATYEGRTYDSLFMTGFLQYLIDGGWHLAAVPIAGGWLEVDSLTDLATYERLHREGALDSLCRLAAI